MVSKLDCAEDVLRKHMYRKPICWNIIRMNDLLVFEHETRLSNGNWLLIIYKYSIKGELTVDKIFDREKLFKDVTAEYKEHPNVVGAMQLINEEIRGLRAEK